jgi:hypothetical protein
MVLERQRYYLNSSSNGERREGESGKKGIKGRYKGTKSLMKQYPVS